LVNKCQLKQNYASQHLFKISPSYGSEAWVTIKRDAQKLEAAQMRFLRTLLGFTRLDHQRNSDIRKKLEVLLPIGFQASPDPTLFPIGPPKFSALDD
jgi:hypothetical protein